MPRAASAAPSARCSSAASTQSPSTCRPFSRATGLVSCTTAVSFPIWTLTLSEVLCSSVLTVLALTSAQCLSRLKHLAADNTTADPRGSRSAGVSPGSRGLMAS
jgi:hypothetical protein